MKAALGILFVLGFSPVAHGKLTLIHLPELVAKSDVIVKGQVVEKHGDTYKYARMFKVRSVLKGKALVRAREIALCGIRSNYELPDLSPTGIRILFLVRAGDCFELTHGNRSVAFTEGNMAHTVAIEDEPETQPLEEFVEKIHALVLKPPAVK